MGYTISTGLDAEEKKKLKIIAIQKGVKTKDVVTNFLKEYIANNQQG